MKSARQPAGFSLAEVLLATLFLSIAFFGYLALHQRLIYSNWKVETRQGPREAARSALMDGVAAVRAGHTRDREPVPGVAAGLWRVRGFQTWTEQTGNQPEPVHRSLYLDTYATVRRPGW